MTNDGLNTGSRSTTASVGEHRTLFAWSDISSSIVVFLVALPLCMGISIASGMPASAGLATGIIGGLVVSLLAGSPLQVSGPAAGLTVVVFSTVQQFGAEGLAVACTLGGLLQLTAGILRCGRWFRAVPPAVIEGMLAGIGVLIMAGQLHVMLGFKASAHGLHNIRELPESFSSLFEETGGVHRLAFALGVAGLAIIIAWQFVQPKFLRIIPGALIAVVATTAFAYFQQWGIERVDVPANLLSNLHQLRMDDAPLFTNPAILGAALVLALIASAESLLCASAVDQLHTGPRTNYDRELAAQGVGNTLCGAIGALPMTGVIVRSAANVSAGAKTRASAFLHGAWLLGLVLAAPGLLSTIPKAALAAVLIFTGFKLVSPKKIKRLWKHGAMEVVIFFVTASVVVAVDLLAGVGVGLGLALIRLFVRIGWRVFGVQVDVQPSIAPPTGATTPNEEILVRFAGSAGFPSVPKIAGSLEKIPRGAEVSVDLASLRFLDHACLELLQTWSRQHIASGGKVEWMNATPEDVFDRRATTAPAL